MEPVILVACLMILVSFFLFFSVRKLYQDAMLNMRTDSMSHWYTAV